MGKDLPQGLRECVLAVLSILYAKGATSPKRAMSRKELYSEVEKKYEEETIEEALDFAHARGLVFRESEKLSILGLGSKVLEGREPFGEEKRAA